MNATPGKNVRVSLPKAFQTKKDEPKNLAVKGVPTDITDNEFKEFLDLNKIAYAKAGSYQCFVSRLTTVQKPGTDFSKFSLPSNRHCIRGGRIPFSRFCQAVLQIPKFRSLDKNM